jgi:hypothetical protein
MSSTEYAELAGLTIALSKLNLTKIDQQDAGWVATTEWISNRITELNNKKRK